MKISYAPDAYNLLKGLFCVYKPGGLSYSALRKTILGNLCRDLNEMETRPPEKLVKIVDDPTSETGLTVTNVLNLVDNPLVSGPKYQIEDFKCGIISRTGIYTSGVCVVGVNCGYLVNKMLTGRYLRSYQISGRFGICTEDYHVNGKILQKTTYRHITKPAIDRVLATVLSGHQRQSFDFIGVDIKSQTAYELVSKGPIRPAAGSPPLVYGIKCIDFQSPDFTIEIDCINENENYLMSIVHDVGITLKSSAACSKVRQTRFGHFRLEHALLRKHWTVQDIINNIISCRRIIDYNQVLPETANLSPDAVRGEKDFQSE